MLGASAGASRWTRRAANGDGLWKVLYFERWNDPCSHQQEREGIRLGWKKVCEMMRTARIPARACLRVLAA